MYIPDVDLVCNVRERVLETNDSLSVSFDVWKFIETEDTEFFFHGHIVHDDIKGDNWKKGELWIYKTDKRKNKRFHLWLQVLSTV